MRLRALITLLFALVACVALPALALPALAQADGDPGSDVLLDQNLFYGYDAGITVTQELNLDRLLNATAKAGAPVRVAIISHPDDLGAIPQLFNQPGTYANYLGIELSDTYDGRLLVVMPNGLGVYWHANPTGATKLASQLSSLKPASATAVVATTVTAVDRIEASAGVDASKLAHPVSSTAPAGSKGSANVDATTPAGTSVTTKSVTHHHAPTGWFLAALILFALLYVGWRSGNLGKLRGAVGGVRLRGELKGIRIRPVALLPTILLLIVVAALLINHAAGSGGGGTATGATLATNPHLDPGTTLTAKAAPAFTLTDQTGQRVSLSQYRGKVVVLAFVDAECQTICPLTTQAMLDAKAALGKAGNQVQLLGVNANWKSTQIDDVLNYTDLHGMTGRWQFLTGSPTQLEQVWKAYGVNEKAFVTKDDNEIDHVAALYLIDPQGRQRVVFTTYPSYATIPQFGQLLAQDVSKLLPDHPPVSSHYSYAEAPATTPSLSTTLPKLGGGSVKLGPSKAHLYLFFATWDAQSVSIAYDLDQLNAYERYAKANGLPSVTAVDEGSVEPSAQALPKFISGLSTPLAYPVAIDQTGSVADGYQVQGEPWFVETNAAGKIVWDQEVYTEGWPKLARLEQEVKTSLNTASAAPQSGKQIEAELAGSAAPLAALHGQASKLLPGGPNALEARVKELHGYPIVLNIWASWCEPCQKEFGLFAKASALYGKRVAFLGADYADSTADAEVFLREHHVSYPSYAMTSAGVDKILAGGLQGTPTTVFLRPNGTVAWVHLDNYKSLGGLESDIQNYALGSG